MLQNKNIAVAAYEDKEATKQNVLALKGPQILHLATHGFFLSASEATSGERGIVVTSKTSDEAHSIFSVSTIEGKREVDILFNPLDFCGLAFSGANYNFKKSILFGSEISSLSLKNTDLVVLSACDTGVGTTMNVTSSGKVYQAQEVYSLRRAFEEAGAKVILSTMWKASDDGTQKFMKSFYKYYFNKVAPQKAVQAVQLEFLKNSKYSHPYYWANFVVYGTDKHFPQHIALPRENNYQFVIFILVIILLVVILYCVARIYQIRKTKVKEQRMARRQKRF